MDYAVYIEEKKCPFNDKIRVGSTSCTKCRYNRGIHEDLFSRSYVYCTKKLYYMNKLKKGEQNGNERNSPI